MAFLADRPRRAPLLLGLLALLTVPFPFLGSEATALGLPLWLWWSAFWTTALSVATSIVILRTWRSLPGADDVEAEGGGSPDETEDGGEPGGHRAGETPNA